MLPESGQSLPLGEPGHAGGDTGSGASDTASAAQDKVQDAAGQAQDKAQQAAGQVQDKLREQIDQRSAQAAEQVSAQASDLRSVSQALRQEGKDGPADAADRLAGYAERVGNYLREKNSDALLADAEDFGRQRPWAAAAGGLAVGLAASRFLKASSGRRYQSRSAAAGSTPAHRTGSPQPLSADASPTRGLA